MTAVFGIDRRPCSFGRSAAEWRGCS